MKHFPTSEFWDLYGKLPQQVKGQADKQFALLKANPSHPSIQLKPVGKYWSARVSQGYRALAVKDDKGDFVWFWIGTHAMYDRKI